MFDCTSFEEAKSNGTATVFEKGNKQILPADQENRPWNGADVLDATQVSPTCHAADFVKVRYAWTPLLARYRRSSAREQGGSLTEGLRTASSFFQASCRTGLRPDSNRSRIVVLSRPLRCPAEGVTHGSG